MSARDSFDLTPRQYHAGLDKLWAALGDDGQKGDDVFTLAAEAIISLRAARDANHASMELMQRLLRLILPDSKVGCLCDCCLAEMVQTWKHWKPFMELEADE